MKYIIKESRLDKLVQTFITNYVGPLKRNIHPDFGDSYIWYTTSKDITVFEISEGAHGLGLGVLESMWDLVKEMFSLSHLETDNAFSTWAANNEGMETPDEIYTFEND
jgi:hypothetical protein